MHVTIWWISELVELILAAGAEKNCLSKCGQSALTGYSLGDALQEVMLYSPLPFFGDAVNAP
jgi:hypothetical protein